MMLFYNRHDAIGRIRAAEFVEIARKHGIPSFNDCAGDAPPVENLSKFTRMGYDLVTFSGGKGLRGPQSSGLLLGRKELIRAARLNGPPNSDALGRGMKVNKADKSTRSPWDATTCRSRKWGLRSMRVWASIRGRPFSGATPMPKWLATLR